MDEPCDIVFTSLLAAAHRDDLERLLFFNDNQAKVVDSIGVIRQRYGFPRIRVAGGSLRVDLGPHEPQTLFAVEREDGEQHPIGVAVYVREDDALVVLYVAVDESYSSRGDRAEAGLLRRIIGEIHRQARRVRGINAVEIYFGRTTPTRIIVRRQ